MLEETYEEDCAVTGAKFPLKLWRLVNTCQSGAISWGFFGKTVMIDFGLFQYEFLDCKRPMFKTKNMTSFIRQLNLYGFRKVVSHKIAYTNQALPYSTIHEFLHENFRLGRPDLLSGVKRRTLPVKFSCYRKSETFLAASRRNFDDILMSSAEFFNFWKITSETLKTHENGEQIVEPMYQIQVIPALETTIENGKVVSVLTNKKYMDRLIDFDAAREEDEPDESDAEEGLRAAKEENLAVRKSFFDTIDGKEMSEIHYVDEESTSSLPQQDIPEVLASELHALEGLPKDFNDILLDEPVDDDFYSTIVKSFSGF